MFRWCVRGFILFITLGFYSTAAVSQDEGWSLACDQAVTAMANDEPETALNYFRDYISGAIRDNTLDTRCEGSFSETIRQGITDELLVRLEQTCEHMIDLYQVSDYTAYTLVRSRFTALGGETSKRLNVCELKLNRKLSGEDWLVEHRGQIAKILEDCYSSLEILDQHSSRFRVNQANTFLRVAKQSRMLVRSKKKVAITDEELRLEMRVMNRLMDQCISLAEARITEVQESLP